MCYTSGEYGAITFIVTIVTLVGIIYTKVGIMMRSITPVIGFEPPTTFLLDVGIDQCTCFICGSTEELRVVDCQSRHDGKYICRDCLRSAIEELCGEVFYRRTH